MVLPHNFPSTQLYYCSDHPKEGEVPDVLWSAVWFGASQDSDQFLALTHADLGGGGVADPQLGYLL